jgi:hypothetical protein
VASQPRLSAYASSIKLRKSPLTKGFDAIIARYLGLDAGATLPITIPHGVSVCNGYAMEVHSPEPLYIGLNEHFAACAAPIKPVIRFPHPWLFVITDVPARQSDGTLFIAPPALEPTFDLMARQIERGDYPKPWGVLIKERHSDQSAFEWWSRRGFRVHSAGMLGDDDHLFRLRDIFALYGSVASPYMSSAVIFAVAMGCRAYAVPDVPLAALDVSGRDRLPDMRGPDPEVRRQWENLISDNAETAREQAEHLLGKQFWDEPAALRRRLSDAIAAVAERPLHLFPLRAGGIPYRVCVALAKRGVPIAALFPDPVGKLVRTVARLCRLNRFTITAGSDFAHHGVVGTTGPLKFSTVYAFQLTRTAKLGDAVKPPSAAARPVAAVEPPPT